MVKKLKPRDKRRLIRDSEGLFLCITPSGHKSWTMRFRAPDGRPTKMVLGPLYFGLETPGTPEIGEPLTLAGARLLATQVLRERKQGRDPTAEHKTKRRRARAELVYRNANSFGAAAPKFFAEYITKRWGTRPRCWREDALALGLRYPLGCDPACTEPEVIKGGLVDTWANKPVADIDAHDVLGALDGARHGIPGLAARGGARDSRRRRMYAVLSVLFGWLMRGLRVSRNPCTGLRPGLPTERERFLNDDEILVFWQACGQFGGPFGPLFKFLLITGCRLREASKMIRSELSTDHTIWTIPGVRVKNHRTHVVPLPPLIREILADVPQAGGDAGYVFTTSGRTPVSGFSKAKRQLDEVMTQCSGRTVPAWKLHDLRRTAVTGMAELGIRPDVIELVVNHVSGTRGGIAGVYNRSELLHERRAALERWAAHVQKIVSVEPKTLKLKRAP